MQDTSFLRSQFLRGALYVIAAAIMLPGLTGAARAGCAVSAAAISFQTGSSYDVRDNVVLAASGLAGLACTGSGLSLLGGSYAKATITSANGFKLSAGGSDKIPYQLSADSGGTQIFTQGATIDYFSANLLSLLGIGSATNFSAPLYGKITAGANIAAGTYTDTLSVQWDYFVCNGIQIAVICLGAETGQPISTVTVTVVVTRDCRINAPGVSFGTAALASGFSPVTQAVLVNCSKDLVYKISFTSGASGNTRPWRAMSDGAGHDLQYNLYRADGTTIWDESNPQTSASIATGSSVPNQLQTYVAKVNPAQPTPPAGTYTDNVSVLVTL